MEDLHQLPLAQIFIFPQVPYPLVRHMLPPVHAIFLLTGYTIRCYILASEHHLVFNKCCPERTADPGRTLFVHLLRFCCSRIALGSSLREQGCPWIWLCAPDLPAHRRSGGKYKRQSLAEKKPAVSSSSLSWPSSISSASHWAAFNFSMVSVTSLNSLQ